MKHQVSRLSSKRKRIRRKEACLPMKYRLTSQLSYSLFIEILGNLCSYAGSFLLMTCKYINT